MADGVMAACWLLANALVVLSVWVVVTRVCPEDTLLQKMMHVLVGWWGCVVAGTTLLGSCGLLTGGGLLVFAVVVSLLMAALNRCWLARSPALGEPTGPKEGSVAGRVALLAWWGVGCLWGGFVLVNGLWRFPEDWDSLAYHIPMIDQWLQAQSLYAPECSHWSNPGNFEVVGLWIVAPFSGDFLIHLANLPAVILLALAALELSRNFGLRGIAAHVAAFATASSFVVLRQLTDSENDVAAAGLWLACLAYACRYLRKPLAPDLILGGVCWGLLAGVKFYALGYALIALVTFSIAVLLRYKTRGAVGATAVWVLVGALFGGYWYVRNGIVTGNPLYPAGAEMNQMYPDSGTTSILGNSSEEVFPLTLRAVWQMTGPCHLAALMALPAVVVWLSWSGLVRGRKAGCRLHPHLLLAGLLLGSGAVWLVTPFAVEDAPGTLNHLHWAYCPVRYGIGFLSLTVIALVLVVQDLLDCLTKFPRVRWLLGFCLGLAFGLAALSQSLFPDPRVSPPDGDALLAGVSAFMLGCLLILWRCFWPRWGLIVFLLIVPLGMVGAADGAEALALHWHKEFPGFYDQMFETKTFSELARADPASVRLAVLDYRAYPFFGSARQFRVWHPMRVPSYPWLTANLIERRVTHAAIRMDGGNFARAWNRYRNLDQWFAQRPEHFVPATDQSWPSVFLVIEPEPREKGKSED